MGEKSVTLLGSNALFFGVAALLYLYRPWAIAIVPAFALVLFWMDARRDEELHIIYVFLISMAVALLVSSASNRALRVGLLCELLGIWAIWSGFAFHDSRLAWQRRKALSRTQDLDRHMRELEKNIQLYDAHGAACAAQLQLRRDMTEAARSLGATLDREEIHRRLVLTLERRYPLSRVRLAPGQPSDPLVLWAMSNRSSLLVKDIEADERFPGMSNRGFRSAIVAPIWVLKNPYGCLLVEDSCPGAFTPEDMRTADLFATQASLAVENVQLLENVNAIATHDALTQLYTHRVFQAKLQEEVLRSGRSQVPFSIVMGDVDHFKRYNDTFGHPSGDFLLKTLAGILTHHARPVDCVARYGGEEFAIVLPGMERTQAAEFAEKARARVAQEPFLFQGRRSGVTMSFGVASFPEDATTPSQLVRAADERLYQAKHGGRNQVVSG